MTGGACRHCGSPAKQSECLYQGGRNFDPPCFYEDYTALQKSIDRRFLFTLLMMVIGAGLCIAVLAGMAGRARAETTGGAWWQTPAVRACCSDADAVYADEWTINADGTVTARVTGGGPRNHSWAPIGRQFIVPADKLLREPGNPTGRPLLFLRAGDLYLYCFAMGAGI